MGQRLNEIAAGELAILNPLTDEDLVELGRRAGVEEGDRVVDIGCGTGELLVQWASVLGAKGTGVDISHAFVARGRTRAADAGLAGSVRLDVGDGAEWSVALEAAGTRFDVAVCLGATWIGGDLAGTAAMLARLTTPDGAIVLGDEHWAAAPTDDAAAAIGGPPVGTTLASNVAAIEALGLRVTHVLRARRAAWDAYEHGRVRSLGRWLADHPEDPDAAAVRDRLCDVRETYERWGRRHLGWAAYVARVTHPAVRSG